MQTVFNHSAMTDGDKGLPPLFCGTVQQQALLHSLPCLLAGLCALLSMLDHFRFGLLLLIVVAAWVIGRCPWSVQRQLRLPLVLLSGPENQLLLQLGNGEQRAVQMQDHPFLHPRLGLVSLQDNRREKYTLTGIFPFRDEVWRLWRLYLRQVWDEHKVAPGRAG
ncbi:hypothetical protein ACJU26_10220 [Acidithiobacillus sp. M4-SHS-6]|uniref:hypothetical protein n=1 Tax=Acidithiobacillus sp. M4-SHS-6 TaxID=3383024 RepID=UPI0039BDB76B